MNLLGLLIVIFVMGGLAVIGIIIKKLKRANLIAGFDSKDENIDEVKLTRIVGNSLIYMGTSSTLWTVIIFIRTEYCNIIFNETNYGLIIAANILVSSIILICRLNRKNNAEIRK